MSDASQIFHFKQFDVAQDQCAMKVGTDGVLLGAWANAEEVNHVLDIGAGTGLISLMVAQRLCPSGTDFHIDAVEIDPLAAQQAAGNVAASPWAKEIEVHACSLAEYMKDRSKGLYDLIVSNPPFYNATLKPNDEARAVARHKDSLPLAEIMQCAVQSLKPEGRLSLIYPTSYDEEVMTEALSAGLKPIRICHVLTKEGKICKRRMAEFGLNPNESCTFETLSIRNADGEYSEPYKELTLPFYTHLKTTDNRPPSSARVTKGNNRLKSKGERLKVRG